MRRVRLIAEADKREAECKANGHKWRNEYNTMRYCENCFHLEKYDWLNPPESEKPHA